MMRKLLLFLCALLLMGSARASVALRMDEGAALVDSQGAEIIPFGVCSDIVPLGGHLFAAVQDGKCALADASGAMLTEFAFDHILRREDLLIGSTGGKWCILNPDGNPRTDAVYGLIVPNGTGGAWAIKGTAGDMVSDELLIIDENGAETQTGLFIRSMDNHAGNGLIAVLPSDSAEYIYCDTTGKAVFDRSFETAGCFKNGAAAVADGGKYAVIAADGETILPAEYDFAAVSDGGIVLAVNATGVTAVDSLGSELLFYPGENLSAAFAGENILIYDGANLLVFASDGRELMRLDEDASVYPGLDGQLILSEGAWGESCVRLAEGGESFQNLFPLGYAGDAPVYAFMEVRVAKYMNNLLGEVQFSADMDTARYGIASSAGRTLLPAIYEQIEYLENDRFLVRIGDLCRMIDSKGTIYWQREVLSAE